MSFNSEEIQSRSITVRGQRWRNNLAHLWSNGPVNLFAEREYNKRVALYWPHCAICQYFHPLHMSDSTSELPERSSRLVSSLCFTKDHSRISPIDLTEDILLTCANCSVSVHPCCYGGENYSSRAIDALFSMLELALHRVIHILHRSKHHTITFCKFICALILFHRNFIFLV
uniref:Uncharacterized protein n=1 Tax=Heterorhabditis bacteriophora TaxID=37862 RepID=A0A1I7XPB7_HETBA